MTASHSFSLAQLRNINLVLFDMDGTLLDLAFDQSIWLELIPQMWAVQQDISLEQAQAQLHEFYLQHHATLDWYSTAFWAKRLGIDPYRLQVEHRERITPRPFCFELLEGLQQRGIACWLVTNADQATLQLKLDTIALRPFFQHIISSESLGYCKEQLQFWQSLQAVYHFDPEKTLLIDDNYRVLTAAKNFGIGQVLSIRQPDSRAAPQYHPTFEHLENLNDLLCVFSADEI